MIKPDLFQSRKGIHVKLDKETHVNLRTKLFNRQITMQSFFEEFAKAFIADDRYATKVIDNMVLRDVQFHIEGKKPEKRERHNSEIDAETLYDLISSETSGSGGPDDEAA